MKKVIGVVFIVFVLSVLFLSFNVFSQSTGRFTIGNEDPFIITSTFAVQEADTTWDDTTFDTHVFDTSIRFNVKDPNPDVLNVRLCIGTSPDPSTTGDCNVVNFPFPLVNPGSHSSGNGAELVYIYNTDPLGTLEGVPEVLDLVQADCIDDFCIRTYFVDIIVDDNAGSVITDTPNSFSIFDNLPVFSNIYLSKDVIDTGADSCIDFPGQDCIINPSQGDLTSVNIQLSITDADADCSTSLPVGEITLCLVDSLSATVCDDATNNYRTYPLTYLSDSGVDCELSGSVPIGDPLGIEFFVAPESYKSYMLSRTDGRESVIFDSDHQWEYGGLIAPDYTAEIFLGDRVVDGGDGIQLGSWNPGLLISTMTNHGNILLNLDWDATDASVGGLETCSPNTATCWDLTTTPNLLVDDDNACLSSSDPINCLDVVETSLGEVILPEGDGGITVINFQPGPGLEVCISLACDDIILEETLNTFFHINPPIGLQPGDYETTIRFYTS